MPKGRGAINGKSENGQNHIYYQKLFRQLLQYPKVKKSVTDVNKRRRKRRESASSLTSSLSCATSTSPCSTSNLSSSASLPVSTNLIASTSPTSTPKPLPSSNKYYSVQEILGRREYQGKIEYLLKWKGYPDAYNSWEVTSNLTTDLLFDFELDNTVMETLSNDPKATVLLKDTPIKIWDIRKGCKDDKDLEYLVQWKNDQEFEWISGSIMKQAFPDLVIDFYERITKMVD